MKKRSLAALFLVCAVCDPVGAECLQVQLVPLTTDGALTSARPTVRWEPVTGATRYHVQLDSRVPEGRRLQLLDTYVTTAEFTPPRLLTDHRARVAVVVTTHCGSEIAVPSKPLRFEIDTAPLCVLASEHMKRDGNDLVWRRPANGASYVVSAYERDTGRLVTRKELRGERVSLAAFGANVATLSVRPKCQMGWGDAVYVPLVPGAAVR